MGIRCHIKLKWLCMPNIKQDVFYQGSENAIVCILLLVFISATCCCLNFLNFLLLVLFYLHFINLINYINKAIGFFLVSRRGQRQRFPLFILFIRFCANDKIISHLSFLSEISFLEISYGKLKLNFVRIVNILRYIPFGN